jgi:hypothetical protein
MIVSSHSSSEICFVKIKDDDIIETFMAMRKRYPEKNKKKY